ncbi:MAG: L-histidine N(alpha)-methyltransferase [Cyanobacteria bacterium J06626_18]
MPANSSPTSPSPFSQDLSRSPLPPTLSRDRLTIEYRTSAEALTVGEDGKDVIAGLTQTPKSLPPKYFYDDQGSQLFEAITALPEYYLTRTERQILAQYADAIARQIGPCDLIELGSGSSNKTRILLDAYRQRDYALRYVPVDVSGGMLEESARALLTDYPVLTIHGLVSTYEGALASLPSTTLPCRTIAFIGSTLGNLPPSRCQQFFQTVSQALSVGDYFLLGVDLHKDTATLEAAYNDSQDVTAAFNLNMLNHLNWRFQGDFDLAQFRHIAVYNDRDRQIEMYIESLCDQTITLKALDLTLNFTQGERLLSEISRKFDLDILSHELMEHGLRVVQTFTDTRQWFGLLLCTR